MIVSTSSSFSYEIIGQMELQTPSRVEAIHLPNPGTYRGERLLSLLTRRELSPRSLRRAASEILRLVRRRRDSLLVPPSLNQRDPLRQRLVAPPSILQPREPSFLDEACNTITISSWGGIISTTYVYRGVPYAGDTPASTILRGLLKARNMIVPALTFATEPFGRLRNWFTWETERAVSRGGRAGLSYGTNLPYEVGRIPPREDIPVTPRSEE